MNLSFAKIQNHVLHGLDGQLFLFGGGQKSFEFSTGRKMPSSEDIFSFFNNLENRKTFCNNRDIPFLHVIFPSKEIVLRNKVPEPWREKIQSLFLSSYASTLSYSMKGLIYPLNILSALNHKQAVFRMLDTHMTDVGTMAVVQHLLGEWDLQYDVSNFFTPVKEKKPADLADMINMKEKVLEDFLKPTFPFMMFDNRSSLPGNTDNVCIVHNPYSISSKRILIFGDSFIKYALSYFSPFFRDVVYVRSSVFQPDMIELMAPDYVISSNAERYLCKVVADEVARPMIFTHYGKKNYTPPAEFVEAYIAQLSWKNYLHVYESWQRKLQLKIMEWQSLGVCKAYQQVEFLGNSVQFRSLGLDPFFVFSVEDISLGKNSILEIDMHSDVESMAALYFQKEGDERFSEINTIKLPVNVGANSLVFQLPKICLKPVLRFDPLTCQGGFSINNTFLKTLE